MSESADNIENDSKSTNYFLEGEGKDSKKVQPFVEDGIDNIVNEDKRLAMEKSLWYWNLSCCILHLIQASICLAAGLRKGTMAGDFRLPLTTLFVSTLRLLGNNFLQSIPAKCDQL